mgnify:CR=1 FL=1
MRSDSADRRMNPAATRWTATDNRRRYDPVMTEAALRIRATLMELTEADRAWLAAELAASLDGPPDTDAAEAWSAEIQRRATEVREGKVELLEWSDVKARLEARLKRP